MPHRCSGKSLLWSLSFFFRLYLMRRSSGEKSVTPLRTSMVSGKWCPIDCRRLSTLQAIRWHESHGSSYILCSLTNPSLFHSNHTFSFSVISYSKAMLSQHNYQNRYTAHVIISLVLQVIKVLQIVFVSRYISATVFLACHHTFGKPVCCNWSKKKNHTGKSQ